MPPADENTIPQNGLCCYSFVVAVYPFYIICYQSLASSSYTKYGIKNENLIITILSPHLPTQIIGLCLSVVIGVV